MAPKRGTKQAKLVNNDEYKNLALSDALCPICRYILVLPVTLPCNHNFCTTCFEGTVANANLTCPLCRVRFASWLRIAKKEDRLVNDKLWQEIQTRFSEKVRNRQEGVEDEDIVDAGPSIKLNKTGEIRREYEEQLRRDREELDNERRAEEAASAELIQKLKKQDALEIALQQKLVQEKQNLQNTLNTHKKRPLDKLIQNMQKHLNVVPNVTGTDVYILQDTSSVLPQTVDANVLVIPTPSTSSCGVGQVPGATSTSDESKKSTKQKNLMHFSEVIEITDSNDSIENECRYFKPIDYRNIPPTIAGTPPLKVPAVFNRLHSFKFESPNKSHPISFGEGMSAFVRFNIQTRKRKLSSQDKPIKKSVDTADPIASVSKVSQTSIPHTMTLRDRKSSNSSPPHLLPASTLLNGLKLTSTREEYTTKLEQERADLELAKKLQEEYNRERYGTRSSYSCRNKIKKRRQLTLTEIMSTSKCK